MDSAEDELVIAQHLAALPQMSFVAHRDAVATLPAIRPFGADSAIKWLATVEALFSHDREAGKAFIRGSEEAARAFHGLDPWCAHAQRFSAWRGSGPAVQAFMAALPAVAVFGSAVDSWATIGLDWCARHMDSGRAYFATPVSALLGEGDVDDLRQLLVPALELCGERGLALGHYLPGALRVRSLAGTAAVGSWARQGGDVLKSGRNRGEAFFALASEESRAVLLEHLPGFRPLAHERLLQILLAVWFGQSVDLREGDWMPGSGRPFIETDGRSLFLPAVLGSREEALVAVWHAGGHLTFGTFEQRAIEELFQAAGLTHPLLDPDQAITWRPLFLPYGEDLLRFEVLFDLCEDLRVDALIHRCIPGYLQRLQALPDGSVAPNAMPYRRFVRHAWHGLADHGVLDQRLAPLWAPKARLIDAFLVARVLYSSGEFPTLDANERADAYPCAHGPNAARPIYPKGFQQTGPGPIADLDVGAEKRDGRRETSRRAPQEAQGGDRDLEIPPEDTAGAGGRVGVGLPQPARLTGRMRTRSLHGGGHAYPEWDYRQRRFRARWAYVQERVLDECDPAEASRLVATHQQTLKRLKRAIEAQKPRRLAPRKRQLEGEDLDLAATVDFVALRRAGLAPRPEIYCQRLPRRRDLAVLLLADLSTSIMERLPDGVRIVDRIRAALLLFAESLEEIGDPYAIAGFASKYRDQVSYYPIKEFNETLSAHARAIIGGLSGRLATRMGAAIRHALTRFDQASAPRRLLLLLSDGRPADYDDGGDPRYLEEDTRLALKECTDRGVHPFCITLDPRGGDYLKRIFGDGHYLVIDRLSDLPAELPRIYLRLRAA
ncbi:MAG: nitric oxide reductase activation protein NorD [Acidiferrobacteraceae bacterium]